MTTQLSPPHFGAFVLETLTIGMYGESRNAIREYIQNGFDSLRDAVGIKLVEEADAKIEVTLDVAGSTISIRDNGTGLPASIAADTLISIGASKKHFRSDAGFRGIGRLAGIAFCNTLTFTTKHVDDAVVTKVVFDAAKLRRLMTPENAEHGADAGATLLSCITVNQDAPSDLKEHFFEVLLSGFENAPDECYDPVAMKTFIRQVSPLPYDPSFKKSGEILALATKFGKPIETVTVVFKTPDGDSETLYKPYRDSYTIKKKVAPMLTLEPVVSPTNKWWGWIGRTKESGTLTESDARGIRVRVRNISIDGTDLMRDIFASPRDGGDGRVSYARFVDWYVGEIFVDPTAAVPNARRDNFEEDKHWAALRKELSVAVAVKYGKQAHKTSNDAQLSVDVLKTRFETLEASKKKLLEKGDADPIRVVPLVNEAKELLRRVTKATDGAINDEPAQLFELSQKVAEVQSELASHTARASTALDCSSQVESALNELTQQLYVALREKLPPAAWSIARDVLLDITGELPR